MEKKFCSICDESKEISNFHKNKSAKDGLDTRCKQCKHRINTAKYQENKEVVIKQVREYRERNVEKLNEYQKIYNKTYNNKESTKARRKEYQKTYDSKESTKARRKEYYEKNRERLIANQKQRYKDNPEHYKNYQREYRENNSDYFKNYMREFLNRQKQDKEG